MLLPVSIMSISCYCYSGVIIVLCQYQFCFYLTSSKVILDPNCKPDHVYSNAFLTLTGYDREEVILRNCRFLQGSVTDRSEVARISRAIQEVRFRLRIKTGS
jgi:hypothetical protein